jgi:L-lactate dehydrogenase complex protein LldF
MNSTAHSFKANAALALDDKQLQAALGNLKGGLVANRARAKAALPEFEMLRDVAKEIKDHTIANLDLYLEAYEKKAREAGAIVHFAETAADAREIILKICRDADAKIVTKGKSMVSEEIGLNAHLEAAGGIEVVETDLGEYLVQIRHETPSHIIAPAIHLTQQQVEKDFRRLHTHLAADRVLAEPEQLVDEARKILRQKFLTADVGITGANFLVAETGSSIIVTNEGNGDLTQSLARTHVVITSIEKLVPTLEDVSTILRLLARSATGQECSTYTTFSTGGRRAGDPDGPINYHVVILDNGRTDLIGTEFQEVLRCIRCGACMNHCPVYGAVGGHAYGWVYPGPIGSVLTPALIGVKEAGNLPNASTFCGKCADVCPMKIPLPKLMRHWREAEFSAGDVSAGYKLGLKTWAWFAKRPRLYHLAAKLGIPTLSLFGGRGRFSKLPLAGGWTKHRDMPAPQGRTFQQLWAERQATGAAGVQQ